MTTRLGVEAPGSDRLVRGLHTAARALEDLSEPDAAAAQIITQAAVAETPRRTGFLASTVRPIGGEVHVGAPYAAVVHNGWAARRIRARPFLRTATETTRDRVLEVYTTHTADVLRGTTQ